MGVAGKQLTDQPLNSHASQRPLRPAQRPHRHNRHLRRPRIQLLEVTSSTFVAKGLIEQSQEILIKLAQESKNLQKK